MKRNKLFNFIKDGVLQGTFNVYSRDDYTIFQTKEMPCIMLINFENENCSLHKGMARMFTRLIKSGD